MRKRNLTKRPGQTLIEVVIATLIGAMTTVAVFSVVLSSFVSQKKADKKELAAMLLKNAQQTLQAFVSAVPGDANYSPNAGGVWKDSSWALSAGTHDISSLMNTPENIDLRPVDPATGIRETCAVAGGCYFTYTVGNTDCLRGDKLVPSQPTNTDVTTCKTVIFNMKYAD